MLPLRRYESLAIALSSALLILPACSNSNSTFAPVSNSDSIAESQVARTTLSVGGTQLQASDRTALVFRGLLQPSALITEKPSQADAFVDAIGVDSGFNYNTSPYVLNFNTIASMLINSGIRHIRDGGTPNPTYVQHMAYLGAHGVKHSAGFGIHTTAAQVKSELATFAPYVDFVEPANEYDLAPDPLWAAHLRAEQSMLWTTVRSNPAYSTIRVIGPPLASLGMYATLGPLDSTEDAGNFHYAACDFNPATSGLYTYSGYVRKSTVYKPIWTTETGYGDDTARPCSTTDAVIAKYLPRTVTVRFNFGEPRIYFNQLADRPTDKIFGATGLLRANGSPKPQYQTLRSMILLLSDKGPSFATTPLHYSLTGATANVQHTLLQKRNGTYFLLLWLEVNSWDHAKRVPINVPAQRVVLNLSAVPGTASQYSYGSAGQLISKALPRSKAIAISLTDTVSFIQLK